MSWIYWTIIGLALIISETMLPTGFYLFLIGLASLITGITLKYVNLELWVYPFFFVIALALNFTVRKQLNHFLQHKDKFASEFENTVVKINQDLEAGASTKVEHMGTTWTAKNVGTDSIKAGTEAKVFRVSGLVLEVKGE